MHRRGALTERVLELRLWGESPFFLLDVGCSGGIDSVWRRLGDRLRAVGFDPLVAEVERLNDANTHPGIRYEAASVICPDYDRLFLPELRNDRIASRSSDAFERGSAAAAMRHMQTPYLQQVFNAGAPVVTTNRSIALDDYVDACERGRVDFIKIDTDGHDIEVILGARAILSAGGVLGLTVEGQFQGATHDYANLFSNIDRILREHGFVLFDLQPRRYSRAALPAPFVYDVPAETTSGQLLWGEAVYFRDLAAPGYERMWPYEVTSERVIKLACLFDLFDLPDCAAELLINRGRFLAQDVRNDLLDQLTSGTAGSYAAHVGAFERDFTLFYPARMRPRDDASVPGPGPTDDADVVQNFETATIRALRERAAKLTYKNLALREKLRARDERLAQLGERVKATKGKQDSGIVRQEDHDSDE